MLNLYVRSYIIETAHLQQNIKFRRIGPIRACSVWYGNSIIIMMMSP